MPPCWRGQSGSTLQVWNFNTSANPAAPESGSNPYGAASSTATPGLGAGGWIGSLTLFGTNQGVWDLGRNGTLGLSIPNAPVTAGAWKYISVQVTQYRDGVYNANAAVTIPGATLISSQTLTNRILTNTLGQVRARWIVVQSLWLMDPSPASESITITAGFNSSAIDQVVVDTLSASRDSGDVFAPCWRGQSGTTHANWSFHNANNPAAPELKNNPGTPSANISVPPTGLGLGWLQNVSVLGCRRGLWDLGVGGTITLEIPETPGGGTSYRYVRVQVVEYQEEGTYAGPAQVAVAGGVQIGSMREQFLEGNIFGGAWVTHETLWRVAPSPASETITITGGVTGALVDQVTVDTLSLSFVCSPNLIVSADAGSCDRANVTWTVPAVDGCIVTSVVCSPPLGSTFPVGTTPVRCLTFDAEGGTNVCDFTVTVNDTQPPVAVPPANMIVAATAGSCGANVSFSATAQDNCPGATVTCTPASGSLFPLGVTTVSCVATDAALNVSATSTFTVRVVDFTGDVAAPCWRGATNATFQQWAFSTGATEVAPERKTNANVGLLEATVVPGPLSLGWQDQLAGWGCRQGYWDLGIAGTINLQIPDLAGSATAYRYVRVQVTQFYQEGTYDAPVSVTMAGATQVGALVATSIEVNGFGGEWVVYQTIWKVASVTDSQSVLLTAGVAGALVDQVAVDTLTLEPPVCPENIVANADAGLCAKTGVTWTVPTADGCVIQAVNDVPASGSTFNVGVTPVVRKVKDAEGQTNTCGFTVTIIDNQPPVISAVAVTQAQPFVGSVNIKDCANPAVQGVVNIAVTATDSCPLAPPTVVLTNGGVGEAAVFVSASSGVFYYTWPVTAATANGTWTATVAAADSANVTTGGFTVCVNTMQVAGQLELQAFLGTSTVPAHSRPVIFVATQVTPLATNILKSWTLTLTNNSGAIFDYTLTEVPAATTHVSAKTAWNLRRKVAVTFVGPSGAANFIGASMLLSGDISANHDDKVNSLDRNVLLGQWGRPAPGNAAADMNGDGNVNTLDRTRLLSTWGTAGDSP